MHLTYCEKCGDLVKLKAPVSPIICDECKAGRTPPKRNNRDSSMIPRKKLDLRINLGSKSKKD